MAASENRLRDRGEDGSLHEKCLLTYKGNDMKKKTNPIVTNLTKAKKLITAGWTREAESRHRSPVSFEGGDLIEGDAEVGYCLIGGIKEANGPCEQKALKLMATVISKGLLDEDDDSDAIEEIVYEYNDAPRRTKKEVLAKLDKAILFAEKFSEYEKKLAALNKELKKGL